MDVDALKTVIERRGFDIIVWIPLSDKLRAVVRLGGISMAWEISTSALESAKLSIGDLIEHEFRRLLRGAGFRACSQCGEILLFVAKYVDQGLITWYSCRSAHVGPHSEILEKCPGCGIEFGYPPPVREVVDD